MEKKTKDNIFPSGTFHGQKPVKKSEKKEIQKKETFFLHIPYKDSACRLTRRVKFQVLSSEKNDEHFSDASALLHIPASPEEAGKRKNPEVPSPVTPSVQKKGEGTFKIQTAQILEKKRALALPMAVQAVSPKNVPAYRMSHAAIPVVDKRGEIQFPAKKMQPVPCEKRQSVSLQKIHSQSLVVCPVQKKMLPVSLSSNDHIVYGQKRSQAVSKEMVSEKIPHFQKKEETHHIPIDTTHVSQTIDIPVRDVTPQVSSFDDDKELRNIITTIRKDFSGLSRIRPLPEQTQEVDSRMKEEVSVRTKKKASLFARLQGKRAEKKKALEQKKNQRKKTGVLGEIVKFSATTAIIFIVSFAVMNASAINELISAKIDPVGVVKKQIALEKIISERNFAPILPTAGMKHENRKEFPDLNLNIGPFENRIVIPKIGKNVPIVDVKTDALQKGDWDRLETDIQDALQDGVVHYPGTAQPGQVGNVFITGHSSYYLWDPGKYKDVFARLHDLDVGDEFVVYWNQDSYRYKIRERKVVPPEETNVLKQPRHEKIATLMTCTPVGTAKDRLVLIAEQI